MACRAQRLACVLVVGRSAEAASDGAVGGRHCVRIVELQGFHETWVRFPENGSVPVREDLGVADGLEKSRAVRAWRQLQGAGGWERIRHSNSVELFCARIYHGRVRNFS